MCDTFVAVSKATEDGSVIFGKNSDREPNEAQCLEYYPPEKFSKNHQLDCTYLSIPQVSETYGVLLCRPFWAALKIKDVYSISNGLTIGEEFDKNHPNLIDNARQKGW
ncbi:MAG: hypothetical protein PF503_16085, partial [Desulfobacula sp.]|nr:hypothetical protein [Desulfobacula sp.]